MPLACQESQSLILISHIIYADTPDRNRSFDNDLVTLSFLKFPGAHCFAFILVFHASSPRVMDEQTQRLLRDSRDKPSTCQIISDLWA